MDLWTSGGIFRFPAGVARVVESSRVSLEGDHLQLDAQSLGCGSPHAVQLGATVVHWKISSYSN